LIRKIFWIVVIIVVVLLLVAQVTAPAPSSPPEDPARTVQAAVQVSPEVESILGRSCGDCHSNKTVWPAYTKIGAAQWLMANDVNDGRAELSFSEFATYQPRKQARKLQEICEQVKEKEMPVWYYLPLHPNAKLSDGDRQTLCAWTEQARATIIAAHPEAARGPERE